MSIILTIASKELGEDSVHNLTLDLCRTLGQESSVNAKLPEGPSETGAKGDPITVGTIILALITGGAVNSLIGVLKSYYERVPSLEMDFKRKDCTIFKLKAENFNQEQIEHTMEKARNFFSGE